MRLLIVDDERIVARAVGRLLALEYTVTLAYSGAEALQRLSDGERFDAILSDVSMPDLDGMQFFERVRELDATQSLRFIFLTGGHISPRFQQFLDHHQRPWIEKPFSPTRLKQLIVEQRLPAPAL